MSSARVFVVALITLLMSPIACGEETEYPEGLIAFLQSPPSSGGVIPSDRGQLFVFDSEAGDRLVASHVAINQLPRTSPQNLQQIPIVQYEDNEFGPATKHIALADLTGESTSTQLKGEQPVAGETGNVALCVDNTSVISIGNTSRLSELEPIPELAADYCPQSIWSSQGDLALFRSTPSGPDGGPISELLIRSQDGQIRKWPVPDEAFGGTLPNWSPDGERLVFQARGRVVEFDVASETFQILTPGERPLYDPTNPDYLAALVRDDQAGFLAVFERGRLTARVDLTVDGSSFAWSPDGSWLAISEPSRLRLWRWRTGEILLSKTVDNPSVSLLPAIYWVHDPG